MANCTLHQVFDPLPYLSIAITSRDIEGNENHTNKTIVVFPHLRGGIPEIAGSAYMQYISFNSSAQKMVRTATVENT